MLKRSSLAAMLGLLLAAHASAQQAEQGDYEHLRNTLGLMQYCESQGHLTSEMTDNVIAIFENILEPIELKLAPEQFAAGDAAEQHGMVGKFGEERADIAEEARRMQTTPTALCQEMHGKIVEQVRTTGRAAYAQVRNQIGVMQYCRDKGHINPAKAEEVISFFRGVLDNYPAELSLEAAASGDEAEKDGVAGKWGPPPRMDIAGMAPLMTAASMCETLSSGLGGKEK